MNAKSKAIWTALNSLQQCCFPALLFGLLATLIVSAASAKPVNYPKPAHPTVAHKTAYVSRCWEDAAFSPPGTYTFHFRQGRNGVTGRERTLIRVHNADDYWLQYPLAVGHYQWYELNARVEGGPREKKKYIFQFDRRGRLVSVQDSATGQEEPSSKFWVATDSNGASEEKWFFRGKAPASYRDGQRWICPFTRNGSNPADGTLVPN